MPKMCAIPQLVSAPLNPIPIAEHFRRSHPQCEHSYCQDILVRKTTQNKCSTLNNTHVNYMLYVPLTLRLRVTPLSVSNIFTSPFPLPHLPPPPLTRPQSLDSPLSCVVKFLLREGAFSHSCPQSCLAFLAIGTSAQAQLGLSFQLLEKSPHRTD